MVNICAHVDLGNQIDNSWNKDTAMALKINKVGFVIKIRERDKKKIEKKYIKEVKTRKDTRHNRKVVVAVYSFLLYKLIKESNGIVRNIRLCNDISPAKDFHRFLDKICKFFDEPSLHSTHSIKFKKRKQGKSRAHRLANRVYKGRKKADYLIKEKDVNDLIEIINKIIL
jgi:hypothetical protein